MLPPGENDMNEGAGTALFPTRGSALAMVERPKSAMQARKFLM